MNFFKGLLCNLQKDAEQLSHLPHKEYYAMCYKYEILLAMQQEQNFNILCMRFIYEINANQMPCFDTHPNMAV